MAEKLPRVVRWLGVVSLATDASGEMIYPLLPLFLTGVLGASASFIGLIEGVAETVASLLKLVSGRIADRTQRRKPLTVAGYGLSSLARPLVGLATAPWMVLCIRITDRIGKGLRSSPRDALLADATTPSSRGRAYGFHRAMDNTGAVIGPLLATLLLGGLHLPLRQLFLLAALPAALAMLALVVGVKEPPAAPRVAAPEGPRVATGARLRTYLGVVALFGLANSSDAFLLLRARALGVPDALIPILWMVHNLVKALLSTAGGGLSDRLGRRPPIVAGWVIYAATYLGFAVATRPWHAWALFGLYGLHYALCEGSEKALVADLAPPQARGRAFGLYHAVVGLAALPASFGFGRVADRFGAPTAFTAAAALAAVAALLLTTVVSARAPRPAR